MRPIYLRRDNHSGTRKVMVDMPYMVSYKKIRLPKWQWEEGLYLPYKPERSHVEFEKYFLSRDNIIKEDEYHYFFDFPFHREEVESIAV